MPKLLNQEAWVESESGERFEEYGEIVEGNVVTCYIASEAEKVFKMRWHNHDNPGQTDSAVLFSVDGTPMDGLAIERTKLPKICSRGHFKGVSNYRPYKFANISLTDEEPADCRKELGMIKIESYRVHIITNHKLPSFQEIKLPGDYLKPLNEKAKKIGSHMVSLGEERTLSVPRNSCVATLPYRGESEPFVKFVFIYRPKDILRALEIIPSEPNECRRSASDSLRERARAERKRKREVEKVKLEAEQEEAALLAQQAELLRKLEDVKKRKMSATVKQEVKQEDIGIVDLKFDANGAIDLTLDD